MSSNNGNYPVLNRQEAMRIYKNTGANLLSYIGREHEISKKLRKQALEIGSIHYFRDKDYDSKAEKEVNKPRPCLIIEKPNENLYDVVVIPFYSDSNNNTANMDPENLDYMVTINPDEVGEELLESMYLRTRYGKGDHKGGYKTKEEGQPYIQHAFTDKAVNISCFNIDIASCGSLKEVLPDKYQEIMEARARYHLDKAYKIIQTQKNFSSKSLKVFLEKVQNIEQTLQRMAEKLKRLIEGTRGLSNQKKDKAKAKAKKDRWKQQEQNKNNKPNGNNAPSDGR